MNVVVSSDRSLSKPKIKVASEEERSFEKFSPEIDFKSKSSSLTYFRVALVGEPGSEKNNVRRAYVQLMSNRNNQFKAEKALKGDISERIDVLDSNVITVQGFQLELMCAGRIDDFKRIPLMIRCSHLDAIIIFYHISSLRQFESIHQMVSKHGYHVMSVNCYFENSLVILKLTQRRNHRINQEINLKRRN
uniref:Ras family protein n=1 Tax=Brugia malayi TaxID=6279 RepID=A0A7I4KBZ7_BRUMA